MRAHDLLENTDVDKLSPGQLKKISGEDFANLKPDPAFSDLRDHYEKLRDEKMSSRLDTTYSVAQGFSKKTDAERAAEKAKIRDRKELIAAGSKAFEKELEDAIPYIERYCSGYLPVFHNTGKFLYRGFGAEHVKHPIFYGKPVENRKPRDSAENMQVIFDQMLSDLKVKALRSNSIFVTSNRRFAEGYGIPYIILPTNDSSYAWSTKYNDIVLYNSGPVANILQDYQAYKHNPEDKENALQRFQATFDFKTYGLEDAMNADNQEIWFTGHYFAVLASLEEPLRRLLFR